MASLKDIRTRIDSVKRSQNTTSAMKMVSAAKLRRSEDNIRAAIPYAEKLKNIVSSLSSNFGEGKQEMNFTSLQKCIVTLRVVSYFIEKTAPFGTRHTKKHCVSESKTTTT